jgi:hypothetical protein
VLAGGVTVAGSALARAVLPPTVGRLAEAFLGGGAIAAGIALEKHRSRPDIALGLTAGGIAAVGRALWGQTMSAILSPPATNSPALIPTVYDDTYSSVDHKLTVLEPFIRSLAPPALMLHSSMETFTGNGKALTDRARGMLPSGAEIWWAQEGDEHQGGGVWTPGALLQQRVAFARAAVDSGIPVIMWDPETAWEPSAHNPGKPGFDKQAAQDMVTAVSEIVGAPRQVLTTYPQPTVHGTYPWQGFTGVWAFCPQIYWGSGIGDPNGHGQVRYERAAASIATAKRTGLLAPDEYIFPYLLVHGCLVAELGYVADQYEQVACWNLSQADNDGRAFMLAMVSLDNLGLKGVGRIAAFQAAQGLAQNSQLDPDTLRALRVIT